MRYHKIRNVDLTTCTAEQMVAYNFAFMLRDLKFYAEYKTQVIQLHKSNIIGEAVQFASKWLCDEKERFEKKVDIDATICALRAGLENYFNRDYSIIASYAEIGQTFPALYLKQ